MQLVPDIDLYVALWARRCPVSPSHIHIHSINGFCASIFTISLNHNRLWSANPMHLILPADLSPKALCDLNSIVRNCVDRMWLRD